MNDYVLLSNQFTLKGSREEQILLGLIGGERYKLTPDQYDLLCLCDGSLNTSEIHATYDHASQSVIDKFLANLRSIGAITTSNKAAYRKLQLELVPSPRLQTVQLEATSVCNLSCAHCYQGKQYPVKDNLNQDECDRLISELAQIQVEGVSLSGGEPLLDDKTYHLAHQIELNDMRVTALFTNGLLLDQHTVAEICSLRSQPTMFISLDTLTPDKFRFRGIKPATAKAALQKVFNGIAMLVEAGLPVVINTAVNQSNIITLRDMHKFVHDIGVASWRLGFPKRAGFFRSTYQSLEASWDKLLSACFDLLRHHLEHGNPFHIQIEYLYRDELFENLEMLPDSAHICDYEGRRHSCCIKPNGNVVSCAYCNDMPLGNIRQKPLGDIWYSTAMQSTKDLRIVDVTECNGCSLREYCAAGCRANASFLGGDFRTSKDHYACQAVQYFVDQVLPYLRTKGIAK